MKQPVYIFDVDGVLNDLHNYESDVRIIAHIARLLDHGTYVAINTGRGYPWVEANVVQPIREQLHDPQSLSHLFVAVEMGGLGVEFVDATERKLRSAFSLTPEQIALVKHIFDQYPQYADRVHWYEGKESMATLDKNHQTPLAVFQEAQAELTAILQAAFQGQHVKVANSTDAIDVHAPEAGKWAGAQLIYDWLRRTTDLPHDRFICFGDSLLDYEMARFFASQSHGTTFVFTGAHFPDTTLDPHITLVKTERPYHEGALDYLNTHAPHPAI